MISSSDEEVGSVGRMSLERLPPIAELTEWLQHEALPTPMVFQFQNLQNKPTQNHNNNPTFSPSLPQPHSQAPLPFSSPLLTQQPRFVSTLPVLGLPISPPTLHHNPNTTNHHHNNCEQISRRGAKDVAVFVGEVTPENLHSVQVPSNESIASFCLRVETELGIPTEHQEIVVLRSPHVQAFDMRRGYASFRNLSLPSSAVLLVIDHRKTSPIRRGLGSFATTADNTHVWRTTNSIAHLNTSDLFNRQVRERVTKLLDDHKHKLSLQVLARITSFSKSALSLWRRNLYKGNNLCVSRAVLAAVELLATNEYQYVPSLHDGRCASSRTPTANTTISPTTGTTPCGAPC